MRTTIRLEDELLKRAREYAARRGRTLTSVIDEALRVLLTRRAEGRERERIELHTVKGRGVQAGVDLENWASVAEAMDSDDDSARR